MPLQNSAEKTFYDERVAGSELEKTPPLEEFASWVDHSFKEGNTYWLVTEVLKNRKVDRLLEIGCGGGESVVWMKKYAKEAIGTDITFPKHLKELRAEGIKYLEINCNDRLPFEDGSVDFVVSIMVLEHVFDPFKFCQEVNRVLKPGGEAIISVPLVTGLRNRLKILFGELPVTSSPDWYDRREWDGGHLHYFNLKMLKRLLSDSGLPVQRYAIVGSLPRLKALWTSFFANGITVYCRKK